MPFAPLRPCLGFLLCALAAAPAARAWDEGGHEIIATIALERLNARARAAVEDLARQVPTDRASYDAVTMACWMDDLRTRSEAMPGHGLFLSWHFIDLGLASGDPQPSFMPGDDNEYHGNAVQGLKRAMVVLQGGTDPYVTGKAMACAIVMHLVGDLHQPLHAATKYFYSRGKIRDDRGGNREGVDNAPPDDPRLNLHAFWDAAWRASMDANGRVALDEAFRPGRGHRPEEVAPLAAEMAREDETPGADLSPRFDAWAWESNQLARSFVYPALTPTESLKFCRLSSGYIARAHRLARQRLVLAGERLAVVLNATLGAPLPATPPPAYPAGPVGRPWGEE